MTIKSPLARHKKIETEMEKDKEEKEKEEPYSKRVKTISSLITGLSIHNDFISCKEVELGIIKEFKLRGSWEKIGNRRVLQYGFKYRYGIYSQKLEPTTPFPDWLKEFKKKAEEITGQEFNQCIVNEYLPGQGISEHTDDVNTFGNVIACISLGETVDIHFKQQDKVLKLKVPRRSLYVMKDEARYAWTHSMKPSKNQVNPRYSITLRTTK